MITDVTDLSFNTFTPLIVYSYISTLHYATLHPLLLLQVEVQLEAKNKDYEVLAEQFKKETTLRKKYKNELEDLKGTYCVLYMMFCACAYCLCRTLIYIEVITYLYPVSACCYI